MDGTSRLLDLRGGVHELHEALGAGAAVLIAGERLV